MSTHIDYIEIYVPLSLQIRRRAWQARTCLLQARMPADRHALQACTCLQQARMPAYSRALQARTCLLQARISAYRRALQARTCLQQARMPADAPGNTNTYINISYDMNTCA